MPQLADGIRIDPPVSVPIDASPMPQATAAADPPLDPPADRDGIDRMMDRAKRGVLAGRAERELMQVGLADEHRAGVAKPRDDWRVGRRNAVVQHVRGRGRDLAGDVDQVLE